MVLNSAEAKQNFVTAAEHEVIGGSSDDEDVDNDDVDSTGPIDEEWHVGGGIYGDECDYFSEDDEYGDENGEELEDDLLDQFRAGLPSSANFSTTVNQGQ